MVSGKDALTLSRWNGSVKLRLNGRIVVSGTGRFTREFSEYAKDANSPSQTCRADVTAENGFGRLFMTWHEDLGRTSCCLCFGKPGDFKEMIDVTSVEASNSEGEFEND